MTKTEKHDNSKKTSSTQVQNTETETPELENEETTIENPNETPEEKEIKDLKEQLNTVTESAKRLMADMTNLKRRNEEEKLKTILYGNTTLIKLLLPGLDNLKRAILHAPENAGEWGKGIEMSIRQIEKALGEIGLIRMETENQKFNPELHEAVLQGDGEENIIIETLEDGYMLGEQVIRHAKVKIGNGNKS